ncbi:MAG: HAMP domain-containing sensor histidine kinase [Actinomycetota bacterium]
MRSALRSLRVRFALVVFVAIYLPVLALFFVSVISEQDTTVLIETDRTFTTDIEEDVVLRRSRPVAVPLTVIAIAPVATALAWWLSGRALRPIEAAAEVQRSLVEEASHELRNPLAVLVNNAEVLLAKPEPSIDEFRRGIERSGTAAQRMRDTVDGLLVDARGRARVIERRPADVVTLVASAVRAVGAEADARSVRVVGPVSDAPITAPVDDVMVERAVVNLLSNAIEHSQSDDKVTVGVAIEGSSEDPTRLDRARRRSSGWVVVTVTDQGPGVAAEDRDRIFERFWTDRPEGTGLGLPVAVQIAEAHGGSISLESPVGGGRGSRFELRLRR